MINAPKRNDASGFALSVSEKQVVQSVKREGDVLSTNIKLLVRLQVHSNLPPTRK